MVNIELLNECMEYVARGGSFVVKPRRGLMELSEGEADAYLRLNRDVSFNERLFSLIDRTGKKDSEIYKKARIDRRLFSKIRSNRDYVPCKRTVIALCLALELDRSEADALLSSAGYSLSRSDDYDLVIAFCIEKRIFDLFDINEILYHFGFEVF